MKWFRKRIGWIAGLTVGGVFLWLVAAVSLKATESTSAGTLFGRKVSPADLLRATKTATHMALLRYGRELPPEELEEAAWERLALMTEARSKGIRISDEEVIGSLRTQAIFQTGGSFDRRAYEWMIRHTLKSEPRTFEEEIREELAIRRLMEKAIQTPPVTEEEVKEAFQEKDEAIQVTYLLIPDRGAAQEVADAAKQNPAFLAQTADHWKLDLITTPFFHRGGSLPGFGTAAFTFGPVFSLGIGEIADPLPSQKGWLVAKLEAKQPPDERKLVELRESLEKEVESQKHMMASLTWYQDLMKRADIKRESLPPPKKRR